VVVVYRKSPFLVSFLFLLSRAGRAGRVLGAVGGTPEVKVKVKVKVKVVIG